MEYKSNIVFAIRSIELYESNPLNEEYGFSAICGVLLNILSAIRPDEKLLIKTDELNVSEFPYLDDIKNLDSYIRLFRNGLTHKYKTNFKEFAEYGEIRSIKVKHNQYTEDDFKLIYRTLKRAIINTFSEDLPEECSRITSM